MTDISKSPDRYTFQKNSYVDRSVDNGDPIDQTMIDMFDDVIDNHGHRFDDHETRKNNMEYDLVTTGWILEKVRDSEIYAQHLYAAMCNNTFMKNEVWPTLMEETWSCSWRYAGGIIADMRGEGDYIDWYCSGIKDSDLLPEEFNNLTEQQQERHLIYRAFVGESVVTDEIQIDLLKLGWKVIPE